MRRSPRFVLVLAAAVLAGCVTTGDYVAMKNEVNQLKKNYYSQDKDIALLKKDVETVRQGAGKSAIGPETLAAFRESQEQMANQVQALGRDLQVLQGRFDENKFGQDKAAKEGTIEIDIMRSRLAKMEEDVAALRKQLAEMQAAPAKKPQEKAAEAPKESAADAAAKGDDPKALYDASQELFKKGEYVKAAENFALFGKKYPNHDLADNAQFWLGESYFRQKNYEDAIIAYEKLIKTFPKSAKAPSALLKQAKSFEAIGDKKSAKVIYQSIVQKYPGTEEAKAASAELDKGKPAAEKEKPKGKKK